ncbi:MAG: GDP-mannose 4,6-dehydratase [Patescibacteria group bacterium]|nr:GDP-mannose 4,6-dehydratase [Patescibacteria group bacterium]
MKNKSILVTGGAGFIGSHLVDALILENPQKIVVVDNFFLGKRENLKNAQKNFKNLIILKQDATDFQKMEKIIKKEKINVIFNLATKALEHSFVDPDDAFMVNVNLASVLLRLLHQKKYQTLIHCSSSEAYGTAKKAPITEDHPLDPETLYAAGKAAADLMVRSYWKTYKLDVAVARPFNTYGPRQNEGVYAAVIPITMKRLLANQPPIICGDGNQTRDFIFVEDTARGILAIYKNKASRGLEINIAYGHEIKIKDLIEIIAKEVSYKGKFLKKPARLADVRRHKAGTKLAREILEFQPAYSFKKGIKKTIEWYKENAK